MCICREEFQRQKRKTPRYQILPSAQWPDIWNNRTDGASRNAVACPVVRTSTQVCRRSTCTSKHCPDRGSRPRCDRRNRCGGCPLIPYVTGLSSECCSNP